MTGIVEFLTARLDEDERMALGVSEGPREPEVWEAKQWPFGTWPRDWAVDCPFGAVVVDGSFRDAAAHIARHDPARVLREVAAKRAIVELHTGDHVCPTDARASDFVPRENACLTLRILALAYADSPDYSESWRPT